MPSQGFLFSLYTRDQGVRNETRVLCFACIRASERQIRQDFRMQGYKTGLKTMILDKKF